LDLHFTYKGNPTTEAFMNGSEVSSINRCRILSTRKLFSRKHIFVAILFRIEDYIKIADMKNMSTFEAVENTCSMSYSAIAVKIDSAVNTGSLNLGMLRVKIMKLLHF
jgi:hypothetical protein